MESILDTILWLGLAVLMIGAIVAVLLRPPSPSDVAFHCGLDVGLFHDPASTLLATRSVKPDQAEKGN